MPPEAGVQAPPSLGTIARLALPSAVAAALWLGLAGAVIRALGPDRWPSNADEAVNRWLARHRTAWLDRATAVLTEVSGPVAVVVVTTVAVGVLLVRQRWREAIVMLVAVPFELAVFLVVSVVVDRPRPAVDPLDAVPFTGSLPSGHVAVAIAMYGGLVVVLGRASRSRRAVRAAACGAALAAVLVALSRAYRGMHHPSDLLAGAALGCAALAAGAAAARLAPPTPSTGGRFRPTVTPCSSSGGGG